MGGKAALQIAVVLLLVPNAVETRAQAPPDRGPIAWQSVEEARSDARVTGRPVLTYVTAPWCALCYRLEREIFPALQSELQAFETAKIDVSERPEPGTIGVRADPPFEWLRRLGLETPPAFLVTTPGGEVTTAARGFLSQKELRDFLRQALGSR